VVCSRTRFRVSTDLVFLFVVRFRNSEISCSCCICKHGGPRWWCGDGGCGGRDGGRGDGGRDGRDGGRGDNGRDSRDGGRGDGRRDSRDGGRGGHGGDRGPPQRCSYCGMNDHTENY